MVYCWEEIDRDIYVVLKLVEFVLIDRCVFEEIVMRDLLIISEIELFKVVNFWVVEKCKRDGLFVNGNEKRRVFGENVVYVICFLIMEEREFVCVVINSDILIFEEVVGVMKYFNLVILIVGFLEKERNGVFFFCCKVSLLDMVNLVYFFNFKKYCIDFCVDKDIEFYGIRMIGSKNGDYVVMVNVTNDRDVFCLMILVLGVFFFVLMRVYLILFVYYGFNVLFDCLVDFKKNVRYRVIVIIDGFVFFRGFSFEIFIISYGVKFYFIGDEDSYDFDNL